MNAEEELATALYSRVGGRAPQPRLDGPARALARLGDPHHAYRMVHLTGTNGKTSTSRIAESLLRAQGLRTGMFTSPDLGRITQRISVDGEPVSGDVAFGYWREVAEAVARVDRELVREGQCPLTFFEALTVLALHSFAREDVDVAVVEVGRGGAWDATNVVHGDVAVFTPIGLDHTAQLGRTIDKIARVKSGIIKRGSTVISARQTPEAALVLREATRWAGTELLIEDADFRVIQRELYEQEQILEIEGIAGIYDGLGLGLHGAHQAQNAAVAIAAAEALLPGGPHPLSLDAVRCGIETVTSPGRLQLLDSHPVTIADAAHNPDGAVALAAVLREQYPECKLVGVVALLEEKDHAGIFAAISGLFQELVITTVPSSRAATPLRLAAAAARTGAAVTVEAEPCAAITRAQRRSGPDGVVVVFGSIMLTSVALGMFSAAGMRSAVSAGLR